MWLLGETLLDDGKEEVTAEGVEWLERAAKMGVGMAAMRLAIFYGQDSLQHFDEARQLHWTFRAAEMGVPLAAYQIGLAFEDGEIGDIVDYSSAVHWYEVAAGYGYPLALQRLAYAFRDGELGLVPDRARADELERRAAEFSKLRQRAELEDWLLLAKAGDRDTQKWLSLAYREGFGGLAADLEQAKYWEERADSTG
nr:hypothetical protein [Ramlibacter albus]